MKVWRVPFVIVVMAAIVGCSGGNATLDRIDTNEATAGGQAKTASAKVEPELEERLNSASPDALIEVMFVLKSPPFQGPPRPAPGTKLTNEELEALTARINAEATAHYARITEPFLTKLQGLGYDVDTAIAAQNLVSLKLKSQDVREVAMWAEVEYVETIRYGTNQTAG